MSHQFPRSFEEFGGRTSPNRLGRSSTTFNHSEDTLEIAPTAYRDGRLLMPQATEQAQNDRDEQIAATDSQLR
jgi:hypothetical protein